MHAVSTSETRTVGLTSFDSVAGFFFGKLPLTARGIRRSLDWLASRQSVRDRPSQRLRPSGHGHRS